MAVIDLASYRSDSNPPPEAAEEKAPQTAAESAAETAAPSDEQQQPAEPVMIGPCEAAFNDMMRQIEAQLRRAAIANPTAKPALNQVGLMRSMMRAVDAVLSYQLGSMYGEVEGLRADFLAHKHGPDGMPIPSTE